VIIDAQVHAYALDTPEHPWVRSLPDIEPPEVNGAQMVAAMDAIGVDAAIYVSPWRVYGADTTYAETVYRDHPTRFRLVAPVDPTAHGVAERVEQWHETPGAVGVRLLVFPNHPFDVHAPGVTATAAVAGRLGMPLNVFCSGRLEVIDELAGSFPETQFVLDHLGMPQSDVPPPPADPFADLDHVLALARHPNLAIKLTGACNYAREPFPYPDLREPVGRIIEAFGIDRSMWGTDWQRSTRNYTYEQGLSAFRDHWPMSDTERAALLGGTAMRIYRWERAA
jgi:L-fuconolactonase